MFEGFHLRDWFAGQALAGLCAEPELVGMTSENFALVAYELADATLKERSANIKGD